MAVNRKADSRVLDQLRRNRARRRSQEASENVVREKNIRESKIDPPLKSNNPPVPVESNNKKLCVGSIFTNTSEICKNWLNLQLRYLKATTDFEYDHFSVIQEVKSSDDLADENTQVLRPKNKPGKNSQAHVSGLNCLRDHFMQLPDKYDHYLFIDMDAFPIRKNWYQILVDNMNFRGHEIAVALRPENLEQRLHSSILMVKPHVLPELRWGVSKVGNDLNGGTESDVHLISHQTGKKRNQSYVLLRSNKHQIHPLLCGVYYDLFYHHCCGSGRNFNMRARPYWKHIVDQKFNVMKTIDDLFANPNDFIGNLVGWENSEYAKV